MAFILIPGFENSNDIDNNIKITSRTISKRSEITIGMVYPINNHDYQGAVFTALF
jgi:hypothetical protein